jgi:hypothetical protein
MNLALTVTLHLPVDGNAALLLTNICFRPYAQKRGAARQESLAGAPDCVGHQGGARADLTLSNFGMIGGRFAST